MSIRNGNTVGSSNTLPWNFFSDREQSYILGLWSADAYHRTSSVGLSNINLILIKKFRDFLLKSFPPERLRLRIYKPRGSVIDVLDYTHMAEKVAVYEMRKSKNIAFHLYVNSRPLLRALSDARKKLSFRDKECLKSYFAGRFDGDGSIANDMRTDCRIVYSEKHEALSDKRLLEKLNFKRTKVYHYKSANTYCLYISKTESSRFVKSIEKYSILVPKKRI